jgi:glycosyltransferase involved in cell wall biosynthesis
MNWGRLTRSLEMWIEKFAPDILYTLLGTMGYMELVRAIRKRFRIPVAVHLMDEGVADPQIGNCLGPWIGEKYENQQRAVISEASAHLGICDKMSAAYSERFGVTFETFMNTADLSRYPPRTSVSRGKVLRLVYTGSVLSFAQELSLLDVCAATIALYRQGVSVQLDIYTPLQCLCASLQKLVHSPAIQLHDAIQEDTVYFKTLQDADILVLPVNFDARSTHYIRYSMPTKVPSYLCSGTPILVYGPEHVAQVEYAQKDRWAYVVNRRASELLKKAIITLGEDLSLRTQLSNAAISTAKRNHDSAFVRDRFEALIVRTAHV